MNYHHLTIEERTFVYENIILKAKLSEKSQNYWAEVRYDLPEDRRELYPWYEYNTYIAIKIPNRNGETMAQAVKTSLSKLP